MGSVKSDIEIARTAKMKLIKDVLEKIGVPDEPSAYSLSLIHISEPTRPY